MSTMNTLRNLLFVMMTVHSVAIQSACTVMAVNRSDVPLHLSLFVVNGDIEETWPFRVLMPGDSCVLVERFRDTWFAYYAFFGNDERTDIQYQEADAKRYRFEPAQGTRPLAHPRGRGHSTRTYTPVFLNPADSVYILEFVEVSTCRGRCINGEGTEYAFGEYFSCSSWKDGRPNGKGQLLSADTLFAGSWRDGLMHGSFTITAPDGYSEEGRFVSGLREGDFTVVLPNKDRLHYHFRNGVLHGEQVQVITREDGYGRERRVLWYANGVESEGPPRDAKRGMYRASPIAR
jgi:hypothetical protein